VEVDAWAESAAHFELTITTSSHFLQVVTYPAWKFSGQHLHDGFIVAGSRGAFTRQETDIPATDNITIAKITFIVSFG